MTRASRSRQTSCSTRRADRGARRSRNGRTRCPPRHARRRPRCCSCRCPARDGAGALPIGSPSSFNIALIALFLDWPLPTIPQPRTAVVVVGHCLPARNKERTVCLTTPSLPNCSPSPLSCAPRHTLTVSTCRSTTRSSSPRSAFRCWEVFATAYDAWAAAEEARVVGEADATHLAYDDEVFRLVSAA